MSPLAGDVDSNGNDVDTDACTSACKNAACGDGFLQAGETCDDGNLADNDSCTSACKEATCGDGFVGPGEACDDGNTNDDDDCTNACGPASCGDGVVQAGAEECDDGNLDDTDACLSSCKAAICGDDLVQVGVEECDDANMDDTDACTSACKNAACGDGFVHLGVETCDDGNLEDTDACTSACKDAACGDGLVHMDVEQCDDGNMSDADACTSLCAPPACDDALQSGDESDIDCGGSCMSKCADGESCLDGGDCVNGFCEMNTCALATSCAQIKQGDPMAASGVYIVDFDGPGMAPPGKVYCDMATDGGGWMMVYKLSAGIAGDPDVLWNGAPLNAADETLLNTTKSTKHYVSGFIGQFWNKAGVVVTDARVHVYKGNTLAKFWKYDGKTSTSTSWYTNTRLLASSYMDLPAGPFNFYSIAGDGGNGRDWFINMNYGGCAVDNGWLVVSTPPDPCAWDSNKGAAPVRILYAPGVTFVNWDSSVNNNQIGSGDVFAVFVR